MTTETSVDEFASMPPPKDIDVLAVTLTEHLKMSEQDRLAMTLKSVSTTGLKTEGEVRKRVMEFIHNCSLQMHPVRLATLNRRFGRSAKLAGTTVSDIVATLNGAGRLLQFDYAGVTAILSKAMREQHAAALAASGMEYNWDDVNRMMAGNVE